jgi:hypothetical protein
LRWSSFVLSFGMVSLTYLSQDQWSRTVGSLAWLDVESALPNCISSLLRAQYFSVPSLVTLEPHYRSITVRASID